MRCEETGEGQPILEYIRYLFVRNISTGTINKRHALLFMSDTKQHVVIHTCMAFFVVIILSPDEEVSPRFNSNAQSRAPPLLETWQKCITLLENA